MSYLRLIFAPYPRTPKLVSEIISGKNRIEPETAIQFERVLGIGADVWLRMEADFRLHQARAAEKEKLSASEQWLSHFPVKDLINWNLILNQAQQRSEPTIYWRSSELHRQPHLSSDMRAFKFSIDDPFACKRRELHY